ncbi:hypothetical protein CDL15_Pgr016450 [Punica granatum]|uniref:RRM domain-containing protein n=1 Tax=Punica granatum TaxID=22663 RepID=A0A218XS39_PUNGR|nr:hypothetical protein CDL15_Pgr016450 [Punica granatum]
MSHFGRSGPPDISDTYSLLVLNITFRTTADDLFPLFDKYGKVVDIFIPRDRRRFEIDFVALSPACCRTGESRGFAFVRYKYADEAQKAVERLDGRVVDGREITVQFAKYGPNAERIRAGSLKRFLGQGTDQEVAALGEGTEMTTEKGILEGGAAAEVGTGTARGTGMAVGGAGVQVQVLITRKVGAGTDMMTSVGAEVDQLTVPLLGGAGAPAGAALLLGALVKMGVPIGAVMIDDLQHKVLPPEVDLPILEVILLEIRASMKILLLIAVSRRFPSFLSNLATSPNPNLSVVLQSPPPLELRMSHFGRSGPPDISDTYSLLVLNITFRTTADDLFPLFDKYGKVVDIFIPRDRRTGESRGFAFVRYKYADEAQKAVDRLDGRVVDGREITVQFAKYGPNAEKIHKGRIVEMLPKSRYRSRSRSPRRRSRDDYRDRDYRRRSRSRSVDRYDRDRYRGRDRDYYRRSRSRSISPDYRKGRGRDRYEDDRRSRSRSVYESLNFMLILSRLLSSLHIRLQKKGNMCWFCSQIDLFDKYCSFSLASKIAAPVA